MISFIDAVVVCLGGAVVVTTYLQPGVLFQQHFRARVVSIFVGIISTVEMIDGSVLIRLSQFPGEDLPRAGTRQEVSVVAFVDVASIGTRQGDPLKVRDVLVNIYVDVDGVIFRAGIVLFKKLLVPLLLIRGVQVLVGVRGWQGQQRRRGWLWFGGVCCRDHTFPWSSLHPYYDWIFL